MFKLKKNNKIIIVGVVLVVAVLGIFLSQAETEDGLMLDLTGKNYAEAQFYANQYGLVLEVEYEDDGKNSQKIISQNIKEGTKLNQGDVLKITISSDKNNDEEA